MLRCYLVVVHRMHGSLPVSRVHLYSMLVLHRVSFVKQCSAYWITCVQTLCFRYRQLKQKLELMTHEVELVRRKLQQTVHHQHQEEVDALKAKIGELMAALDIKQEFSSYFISEER